MTGAGVMIGSRGLPKRRQAVRQGVFAISVSLASAAAAAVRIASGVRKDGRPQASETAPSRLAAREAMSLMADRPILATVSETFDINEYPVLVICCEACVGKISTTRRQSSLIVIG